MHAPNKIPRPSASEYPESYRGYLVGVPGDDAWPELAAQPAEADRRLGTLTEERALHRYAPGKWSVKEVLGHLCDNERVFAYRALRFARGDATPLSNYDEKLYAKTGRFDARPVVDLLDEFRAVRAASIALYRTIDEEALRRSGVARGDPVTVRALIWVTVGHVRHHLGILRERYGIP